MHFDEPAISVRDLSKSFDIYPNSQSRFLSLLGFNNVDKTVFPALSDISFSVKPGEVVGIVGRNGCGKSTLLQMIAGVLNPTKGQVELVGRVSAILELGAGFNPDATGIENIYTNAAIMGYSNEQIARKLGDIVGFADLGDFIDRPVKLYSSGMYVRLAFAVAINVDPDVLIIDEALSVGDAAFQRKCFAKLERLREQGTTILFVSHSETLVVELCDRALLLEGGKLIFEGTPNTAMAYYNRLLNCPIDEVASITQGIVKDKPTISMPDLSSSLNSHSTASFLDVNLRSQSTVLYASKGAIIENPQVHSLFSGEKVNNLVRGEIYKYTYDVVFNKTIDNVRFGCMFKTTSGVEIGGMASHTTRDAIKTIPHGSRVSVSFTFYCLLNPNLYFLNAGVLGCVGGDEEFIHRALDFYMFKVQSQSDDKCTGSVDLRAPNFFEFSVSNTN